MDPLTISLDTSAAAVWRNVLVRQGAADRSHWATKTSYYRGVIDTLERGVTHPSWTDVVEAVRPRGSRTTFYDVAGRRARNPLLRSYQERDVRNLLLLSFLYQRPNAVEQVIDETKVWSFWPYREHWLAGLDRSTDPARAAADLIGRLVEWAARNSALAGAIDHAPPICVVEDLMMVCRWELAPVTAVRALGPALRKATRQPPNTGIAVATLNALGPAVLRGNSVLAENVIHPDHGQF